MNVLMISMMSSQYILQPYLIIILFYPIEMSFVTKIH